MSIKKSILLNSLSTQEGRGALPISVDTASSQIREGVLFHDGNEVTAEDVVFSAEVQRNDPLVGLAVKPFYPAEGAFEALDRYTVRFNLLDSWASFCPTSQLGWVASKAWLEAALADPTLDQKPVGSGPFRFDTRTEDSVTRFVRNEDYWNGENKIMYLNYFDKFRDMEPYLKIGKKEWAYIKETFDRPDIQETLVEILKDYELPTQELTRKHAYKDFMKLKGIQWPDYLVETEWYARSEYKWPLSKKIIRRINRGNDASNYFQQYNFRNNMYYPGLYDTISYAVGYIAALFDQNFYRNYFVISY